MAGSTAESGLLWVLGAGRMGGAMLRRWLDVGHNPAQILIIDRSARAQEMFAPYGVRVVADMAHATGAPDMLMLAIKPQYFQDTVSGIAGALHRVLGEGVSTTLLSVMAGVTCQTISSIGAQHSVVRAMPNTPCAIGEGVTALFSANQDAAFRAIIDTRMQALGAYYWCDNENQLHDATAITGSGPAYVYVFLQALQEAAQAMGFDEIRARDMALQTIKGAALLAGASGKNFAALADEVTSPAGTTRAARDVLDDRLKQLLIDATAANKSRSIELSKPPENKA